MRDDAVHPVSGIRQDLYPAFQPASHTTSHFDQFKSKVIYIDFQMSKLYGRDGGQAVWERGRYNFINFIYPTAG